MSKHLDFVRSEIDANTIRAAAEGSGLAAVLTDSQLIVGKAGTFGGWGRKLQRYELSQLREVRSLLYPSANVLSLSFVGTPSQAVSVLYKGTARAAFEPIVAALQARANANDGAMAEKS